MFYGETKHVTRLWQETREDGVEQVYSHRRELHIGGQAFDTRLTTRGFRGWQPVLQAAWKVTVSHSEDGLQVMQLLFLTQGLPPGLRAQFELFFPALSFSLLAEVSSMNV